MTRWTAALPMYDADREAVEAWWRAIASNLSGSGWGEVPASLEWPHDLDAHWRDARLLLGQMCGFPLVTKFLGAVQVVGAFRYTVPGCVGIGYRSELVARRDDGGTLEDFRGRVAAVNSFESHSGSNALRSSVARFAVEGAFFGRLHVSGSHRRSLAAVQSGVADIAAIDCISLAGIRAREPGAVTGLRTVGSTPLAPGLPLVTSKRTTPAELTLLREALAAACADPSLAQVRQALFIGGFDVLPPSTWQVIDEVRQAADRALWRETPVNNA